MQKWEGYDAWLERHLPRTLSQRRPWWWEHRWRTLVVLGTVVLSFWGLSFWNEWEETRTSALLQQAPIHVQVFLRDLGLRAAGSIRCRWQRAVYCDVAIGDDIVTLKCDRDCYVVTVYSE
jgi:hypothetical protein